MHTCVHMCEYVYVCECVRACMCLCVHICVLALPSSCAAFFILVSGGDESSDVRETLPVNTE